ncbi:6-chlorohydroxyquinol-1,2-dioxygenase [Streptomyces sp. NBC_01549]|uniref:dioxygenase family protein n=1 Tax=unclassified Streptomyces TaxID=2593676 RepID=UPI002255F915|nr:dioxygenase [Streptomyces sp. NBC_01549]MCX4597341.1 6-chlorohydroxyquinol-1,2-dioxygenase [Streptomyces sp. NBC_01549]
MRSSCSPISQEFVLLSDILGVSMLVETINGAEEGTESTVLGPFHMTESPAANSATPSLGTGRPCAVSGRVLTADATPLQGAELDVWQCSEDGFYDVQQPAGNGRGHFRTDEHGRYWFRTVVPSHYPIPTDGPVDRLLEATGRQAPLLARPHPLIAGSEHHRPITTHAFVAGRPYVDSDAVFAVKRGLITDFTESHDEQDAERFGVTAPFIQARFDIVLAPVAKATR